MKNLQILDNPTQEDWFDIYADELIALGYIDEVVRHPDVPTFELFPGLYKPYGKKKNVIMNPVSYTPDRIIKWNMKSLNIFFTPFDAENSLWDSSYFKATLEPVKNFYYSIIEVKGPTGNQKAYNQDFKFTQRWLWANTNQFVQKVMLSPVKPLKKDLQYLWASTFTPNRYLYTDKLATNKNKPIPYRTIPNKKGKPNWEVRSLQEFLNKKEALLK